VFHRRLQTKNDVSGQSSLVSALPEEMPSTGEKDFAGLPSILAEPMLRCWPSCAFYHPAGGMYGSFCWGRYCTLPETQAFQEPAQVCMADFTEVGMAITDYIHNVYSEIGGRMQLALSKGKAALARELSV
jgi:hypothetical protein